MHTVVSLSAHLNYMKWTCLSLLYSQGIHGGLEENGWHEHISLFMCMEYSRIQKKLKRVWRKKNKLDHEGTIRMINQAWVTYIEMGTGIF